MARIYLSASYTRRSEMQGVRDVLVNGMGHEVTSRWIDQQVEEIGKDDKSVIEGSELALKDMEDICQSTCFIMFTGDSGSRGGRHTELGFWYGNRVLNPQYYYAHLMQTIVVGPRENPFQGFSFVAQYATWYALAVDMWESWREQKQIKEALTLKPIEFDWARKTIRLDGE